MKTKVTLKQIASDLNISVSTVSKSLNDSLEITDQTKTRVKEYARFKNYTPNRNALNLKNGKTKTIGVIIPTIRNSFFAKVFCGIEKVTHKYGYNVIMCISDESVEKEEQLLRICGNGTLDGFILCLSEESQKLQTYDHFTSIINDGIPIVLFDRNAEEIICDKVVGDDFDSGLKATQHLIDIGCKNIALLSSHNLSIEKRRYERYSKALKDNNIVVNPNLIIRTDSELDLKAKMECLFDSNVADGIFALDEIASVFALNMGVQKGYKIPDELAIVGFADGILASRILATGLSTISQYGIEMGEAAAKLLIKRLESKEVNLLFETVEIKTRLKQRESTNKN